MIRIAFSNLAFPDWSLPRVFEFAATAGVDGVELRRIGPDAKPPLLCDPARMEPQQVQHLAEEQGVSVAAISTGLVLGDRNRRRARQVGDQVMAALDEAAAMGSPDLRVFADGEPASDDKPARLHRLAERDLPPLVDHARSCGVRLLIENAGLFATAKACWWLQERLEQEANASQVVRLSWNVAAAAVAGEPASVSLPMLHRRLGLVKLEDLRFAEQGPEGPVALGQGDLDMPGLIRRLMGLGYDGYVSLQWNRLWRNDLEDGQTALSRDLAQLRQWRDEITEAGKGTKDAKSAAKKPAAKGKSSQPATSGT